MSDSRAGLKLQAQGHKAHTETVQCSIIKVASAVPTALGSTALPALLEKKLNGKKVASAVPTALGSTALPALLEKKLTV